MSAQAKSCSVHVAIPAEERWHLKSTTWPHPLEQMRVPFKDVPRISLPGTKSTRLSLKVLETSLKQADEQSILKRAVYAQEATMSSCRERSRDNHGRDGRSDEGAGVGPPQSKASTVKAPFTEYLAVTVDPYGWFYRLQEKLTSANSQPTDDLRPMILPMPYFQPSRAKAGVSHFRQKSCIKPFTVFL